MNGTEKKDRDLLIEGLQRMDLKLSDQVIDQLMTYLNLVEKWNRVYNLTAIRERDEMIKLHFLDSLSILNHVHVKNILDVGSHAVEHAWRRAFGIGRAVARSARSVSTRKMRQAWTLQHVVVSNSRRSRTHCPANSRPKYTHLPVGFVAFCAGPVASGSNRSASTRLIGAIGPSRHRFAHAGWRRGINC